MITLPQKRRLRELQPLPHVPRPQPRQQVVTARLPDTRSTHWTVLVTVTSPHDTTGLQLTAGLAQLQEHP